MKSIPSMLMELAGQVESWDEQLVFLKWMFLISLTFNLIVVIRATSLWLRLRNLK